MRCSIRFVGPDGEGVWLERERDAGRIGERAVGLGSRRIRYQTALHAERDGAITFASEDAMSMLERTVLMRSRLPPHAREVNGKLADLRASGGRIPLF